MPKTSKPKPSAENQRRIYSIHPWQCQHHKNYSEIAAYVEASGTWETIAVINATSGFSPETVAEFMCGLVNDHQRNKSLLQEAMEALELCLEEDGLTFSSEQIADKAVVNIKKSMTRSNWQKP